MALSEWVRPIAYCEIDPYCQGVLLSRMSMGQVKRTPIWDDIRTLDGETFWGVADIIYGGFPCQDISVAGRGKGLAGERSGLYWEIHRLCMEIRPRFLFLENVPAITIRGGTTVVDSLTKIGYDCRWTMLSAEEMGAPHKRERWFLLAHSKSCRDRESFGKEKGRSIPKSRDSVEPNVASNSTILRCNKGAGEGIRSEGQAKQSEEFGDFSGETTNAKSARCPRRRNSTERSEKKHTEYTLHSLPSYWEETEPPLCGVDDAIPNRVDRIRALGNAVVPLQAKEAFKILMGLK